MENRHASHDTPDRRRKQQIYAMDLSQRGRHCRIVQRCQCVVIPLALDIARLDLPKIGWISSPLRARSNRGEIRREHHGWISQPWCPSENIVLNRISLRPHLPRHRGGAARGQVFLISRAEINELDRGVRRDSQRGGVIPIDQFPKGLDELGPGVAVIDIVCVFPHVAGQ